MRAGIVLRLLLLGPAGVLVLPLVFGVLALRGPVSGARAADGGPSVIATIRTGPGGHDPYGVAVNANTNRIYVANIRQRQRLRHQRRQQHGRRHRSGRDQPYGVAVNPSTNRIYVTNWATATSPSSTAPATRSSPP